MYLQHLMPTIKKKCCNVLVKSRQFLWHNPCWKNRERLLKNTHVQGPKCCWKNIGIRCCTLNFGHQMSQSKLNQKLYLILVANWSIYYYYLCSLFSCTVEVVYPLNVIMGRGRGNICKSKLAYAVNCQNCIKKNLGNTLCSKITIFIVLGSFAPICFYRIQFKISK